MNSVLLDTSFLICLSNSNRPNHLRAKEYFQRFISAGITMHLSTIVISEYEVKQQIEDLGLHNFIVIPFNYEDAKGTAQVFIKMHSARKPSDERDAVKDDSKLLGQCIINGISHFATDDGACAARINRVRTENSIAGLPFAINLQDEFWDGWFSVGNQGHLSL